MEDFNINITSQDISYNNSNITSKNEEDTFFVWYVVIWIIPSIGLPLILLAIYALYSQVRNDRVAPIYVINLLLSDLIQLCCLIFALTQKNNISMVIHIYCLMASVGFMVCVALERYLIIACPVWYRFRQNIKNTVVVCVVVWALPLFFLLPAYFWEDFPSDTILGVLLLLPLPLFIFFLGGTLKALSSSRVRSEKKRRIVGILVLVLLIYMLLFLPEMSELLANRDIYSLNFGILSEVFIFLNPLADLVLYVFMRKGTIDKLLACVCCRMDSNDISTSTVSHSSIV